MTFSRLAVGLNVVRGPRLAAGALGLFACISVDDRNPNVSQGDLAGAAGSAGSLSMQPRGTTGVAGGSSVSNSPAAAAAGGPAASATPRTDAQTPPGVALQMPSAAGSAGSGTAMSGGDTAAGDMPGVAGTSSAMTDACGNAQLDPGEECDDGNQTNADGCSAACTIERNVAFVTSTVYTVASLGGVSGADAACQARAAAANLPGNFIAYIDDGITRLFDRLGNASSWVRVDGKPFTDNLIGRVFYPPELDESGSRVPATPLALGQVNSADTTCAGWTSTGASAGLVQLGDPTGGFGGWELAVYGTCSDTFRLYCLQKDFQNPVRVTPATGRTAFVSDAFWIPGGGIAAADAVCQNDAQSNGLAGTYRALLATSTASALSRFDTSGAPWIRVDGVPIVEAATDLSSAGGRFVAAFQITASNNFLGNDIAWTGSTNPAVPGTRGSTCDDWQSNANSASGTAGSLQFSSFSKAFGSDPASACDTTYSHLYCLQL
jgi:cysteine-rich repeat protein